MDQTKTTKASPEDADTWAKEVQSEGEEVSENALLLKKEKLEIENLINNSDLPLAERVRLEWEQDPSFYMVIFFAGFVQGSESMSSLTLTYLLKDELALNPGVSESLLAVASIPWILKPLWGFMSDGCPIFGYRRKSYICLAGILAASMWIVMATTTWTPYSVTACMFMVSLATAFLSTVSKALIVEHCEGQDQEYASFLQTYFWGCVYSVALVFGLLGGYLIDHTTKEKIFALTAIPPIICAITALFLTEEYGVPAAPIRSQLNKVVQAFKQTNDGEGGALKFPLWRPALFMLLFSAMPNSASAMFYFFTDELGFSSEFIAIIGTISYLFSLLGIILYQRYFCQSSYRSVLFWATITFTFFATLPILVVTRINVKMGIPDKAFILSDNAVKGVLGELANFPLLVLASRVCPPGVEGTLYAALMSILNLGSFLSSQMGAGLTIALGISKTNLHNLPYLIAICSFAGLIPLVSLQYLLPDNDNDTLQGAINLRSQAENADAEEQSVAVEV